MIDKKIEKQAQHVFDIITQIRNLRSSIEIKPEQKVKVSLYPHARIRHKLIKDSAGLIKNLANLEDLRLLDLSARPNACLSAVVGDIDIYLHFTGLFDIAQEQQKIKEKMNSLEGIIKSKESRIKNPEFIKKAPRDIVEKEKEGILKLNDEFRRLKQMFNELR
jgi:valyl-tRNA synthetase